jgi:hypothetical protein
MTLQELKTSAAAVASEMASGTLTPELRARFIRVRAELFQRGVFDPVLARFDSATVAQAAPAEAAAELGKVAEAL